MQRYDSYKPSGVKWLGEIPSHWEVIKSKYLWKESFSISENGNEELLSVSQYDGITPAKGDSRSESLKGYKIVSENDLVINIMLAWMGGLGVSKYDGIVSPAYCVYKLTNDFNPKYLHYLYRTPLYLAEFARHSSGVIPSRWRMYTDDFGQVVSLLPPRKEQDAIVEYLDEKMAKTDAAIAQQQKMIDLLNESKQIIINRAVTKGLNPNAKMKDSGVEWIGEVPEEWEVLALKYIIRPKKKLVGRNSKNYDLLSLSLKGIIKRDMDNPDGKWPASFDTYQEVLPGDFIFCNFDNEETPRAVGLSSFKGMITGAYDVMYCFNKNVDTQYLLYYLLYIDNGKRFKPLYKGLRKTVPIDSLMRFKIPIPPMKEQVELVNRLVSQTRKIDGIIQSVSNQISLLQERKQIIINEVVTGKVMVCKEKGK